MLFPIRCFTCGKVINQFYNLYLHMIEEDGKSIKEALDILNIKRYCCRRMFMCHNDIFDYISEFDKSHYSFIQDKFEKTMSLVELENRQCNQIDEVKNSDDSDISDISDTEFDENIIVDDDITIDEEYDE